MKTLFKLFEVSQIATTESELLELVTDEAKSCIVKGDLLAVALISVIARNPKHVMRHPEMYRDLAFKLFDQVKRVYGVDASNPIELCKGATKKLHETLSKAIDAVKVFGSAQCIAARNSSIDLLKSLRQLKPIILPQERPLLSSIEMLLGSGFREFCQNYERSETQKVV